MVFEGSREEHFPQLLSWAQQNGASCEGFTVGNFGKEGFGLQAARDIKVGRSSSSSSSLCRTGVTGGCAAGRGAVPLGAQEDVDDGAVGPELRTG